MLKVQFYLKTVILAMKNHEEACVICRCLALLCALFLSVQHSLFVNLNLFCTELDQTLQFCRIKSAFFSLSKRPSQHLPG